MKFILSIVSVLALLISYAYGAKFERGGDFFNDRFRSFKMQNDTTPDDPGVLLEHRTRLLYNSEVYPFLLTCPSWEKIKSLIDSYNLGDGNRSMLVYIASFYANEMVGPNSAENLEKVVEVLNKKYPGTIVPEGSKLIDASMKEIKSFPPFFRSSSSMADLSGIWMLNKTMSALTGAPSEVGIPNEIKITQQPDSFILERTFDSLPLNKMVMPFNGNAVDFVADSITNVSRKLIWSHDKQLLTMLSFYRISGSAPWEFTRTETFSLMNEGEILLYQRISSGPQGIEKIRMVYEKGRPFRLSGM